MNFKSIATSAFNATKKGVIASAEFTKAVVTHPEVKESAQVLGSNVLEAAKTTGKATVTVATKGGNLLMAVYRAAKDAKKQ